MAAVGLAAAGWSASSARRGREALEALGGVLWLASVPLPLLLAFGGDEARPEALRIGVLGALHAALRRGRGEMYNVKLQTFHLSPNPLN